MILPLVLLGCLSFIANASADCPNCATVMGILGNITQPRQSATSVEFEISNIQIVLNPGNRVTYSSPRGEFSFHDVPPGSYRLDIHALNNFFDSVFLDVIARGTDGNDVSAYIINYQAKRKEMILHPFTLYSRGHIQYFETEEEFSIMSMVKSPYGLMIGMMVLMMFCAKNMPSADEMEEQQRQPVDEGQGANTGNRAERRRG